jgi:hypothetical protein
MSIFGGGKQSGTTQTVQSNEPWAGSVPYLNELFYGAGTQYKSSMPGVNDAASMMADRAKAGSPLMPAAQRSLLGTINGDYLSPDSNPFLKQNVDTAMGQAKAAVNSNFTGDNNGNSAHQEWLNRTLGQTAAQMYGDNYNRERGMQMQGILAAPGQAAADYNDPNMLLQASQAPWMNLQNYAKTIGGFGGGSSTTQQPYFTNPLGSAAGGALAGGAIGGPWGAGIGAGLGLLMGR